jgi:dTDP-4-amino-4,6-dideoxygalactose transaminase
MKMETNKRFLPLARPSFDGEELKEITEVLDSGWVSQGEKCREFEKLVSSYVGSKHAVAVSNCTSALHLALLSIGIKADDEVLVADYTFPATGHAVLYCGAKPVFVDVSMLTYNMDIAQIESKITERTKAIIPVHTFGQPTCMNEIMKIAKEHDLKVIEDAACSIGAKCDGKFAGAIGDVGCYSFHARKGITTGEGGMAVTNDDEIAEKIRSLSAFGTASAWDREKEKAPSVPIFSTIGYNYKMSDITAAVGVAQMRKIDAIIQKKRMVAKNWNDFFSGWSPLIVPYVAKNVTHVYQSYVVLLDSRIDRDELIVDARANGIQTQIGTYALHDQPVYGSKTMYCPSSSYLSKHSLALPIYADLTADDIYWAGNIIKNLIGDAH